MSTAIWWIRRDLRLSDNQALSAAMDHSQVVLPVFILDPQLLASSYNSEKRQAFLFAGLRALDKDLRSKGSALILRQGEPRQVLSDLIRETNASGIFAEADYSPYARRRDEGIKQELPLTLTGGITVHPPETLHKDDGTPYTVFTPFSRMWYNRPFPGKPLAPPARLSQVPPIASMSIPSPSEYDDQGLFPAGEAAAQQRLDVFSDYAISRYNEDRNRMDLDGTSGLSPYLRFGMLSARQAVWAARHAEAQAQNAAARRGAETWLNELIWREFYIAILYHFPFVREKAFRPALREIPWRNDPDDFQAWAAGRTGYPVVDAAMRQLHTTGWMHNRARMIVASFLTKDLLVDWRWGERYFMQQLIDGDPASNNGGWQWTAGTGTDAAPYFRVFNPVLQGIKFDPHGAYVRRWVPELAAVPDEYIHTPWKMPTELQRSSGLTTGREYPAPIVDHGESRQRVLAAYRQEEQI